MPKYRKPQGRSVTGLGLTKEHIERYKRGKTTMSKDRNFLIFDLDRPEILQRLEAIPDATIIATNPCFELWYLLHYTARRTALTSEDEQLHEQLRNYQERYDDIWEYCKDLERKYKELEQKSRN